VRRLPRRTSQAAAPIQHPPRPRVSPWPASNASLLTRATRPVHPGRTCAQRRWRNSPHSGRRRIPASRTQGLAMLPASVQPTSALACPCPMPCSDFR
jgi:hypothetical protein